MPPQHSEPSLYGISSGNSNRFGENLWGKNQFNSTFPLALCLFMRDKQHLPVCVVSRGGKIIAKDQVWKMSEVIGEASKELYFCFEETFSPYASLSRNEVDKIDLVVSIDGTQKIPLEIKLTVVPDSSTVMNKEKDWAPEMVVRPVSSAHAMMGLATSLLEPENFVRKKQVVDTLKKTYNNVSDWSNTSEILQKSASLIDCLSTALEIAEELQNPFLIQPLWRTKGQSLELCDACFDVFVWSDVAVMRIPIDQSINNSARVRVPRPMREVARHVRALYDLLVAGDYDYTGIYKEMALGRQTDKSFSLPGKKSINYLQHYRLNHPLLPRDALRKLILGHGETKLQPERRFDAAVLSHYLSN